MFLQSIQGLELYRKPWTRISLIRSSDGVKKDCMMLLHVEKRPGWRWGNVCVDNSRGLMVKDRRCRQETHPLTPMMMDAMAQAPARVAQELTKTGPMMRRDEVSMITCIRRSHVTSDQSGCRCRLASLTDTCCTEHDAVEQLPQQRGIPPARLRRAVSWRARLASSKAEKYRRACAVR